MGKLPITKIVFYLFLELFVLFSFLLALPVFTGSSGDAGDALPTSNNRIVGNVLGAYYTEESLLSGEAIVDNRVDELPTSSNGGDTIRISLSSCSLDGAVTAADVMVYNGSSRNRVWDYSVNIGGNLYYGSATVAPGATVMERVRGPQGLTNCTLAGVVSREK